MSTKSSLQSEQIKVPGSHHLCFQCRNCGHDQYRPVYAPKGQKIFGSDNVDLIGYECCMCRSFFDDPGEFTA